MSKMIVNHKVEDFDTWKKIFDASELIRVVYGEKEYEIFRNTDDPNDVTIVFDWGDPYKALKYAQSNDLREAMKLAGVKGEPIVYLRDEDLKG